jgi:enoyl-CoA hydratase/carnithine racemase
MKTIRFERDGAIGNIVLANPPFNLVGLQFAEALQDAVHQAGVSDIRVLLVRAEDRISALAAKSANGPERMSIGSGHLSRS